MSPDDNNFYNLLDGFRKFERMSSQPVLADLPELEDYCLNLKTQVCNGLIDAETLLSEMDPAIRDGNDFAAAVMVAHTISNCMERVMTTADIGRGVLNDIERLQSEIPEAGVKPATAWPRCKRSRAKPEKQL